MHSKALLSATIGSILYSTSLAHMVMKSPVPYGASSLTNGPLAADGSDFPCKQRAGVYDVSKMNSITVGAPQALAFTGSAVHGGGSCQVSISLDEEPTKDSEWKVIHSIVGGCPSNVTGNLPENAQGSQAAQFQFTVPDGFPNGKATLAWSWLNKVGNREFYMNCAPIEVTGGSDDHSLYNSLPDMFIANIPATSCGTTENEDFVYPNPGDSAETRFSTALGSKTLGSSCQQPTQGSGAKNYGAQRPAAGGAQLAESTSLPVVSAVGTKNTQPVAINVAPSTTLATVAANTSPAVVITSAAAETTAAATTSPALAASTVTADSGTNGQGSNTTCASGSVPCPQPGSIICVGSSQFGLCDINYCAVAQSLALGTHCTDGTIAKRSIDRHLARHLGHFKGF